MSATRYERTNQHVLRSGDAWIVLWYLRSGNLSAVLDDRTHVHLEPGSLRVLDWSVPHVAVATDYELVTVAFPRSQVPAGRMQPALHSEQDYWQAAIALNGWIASRRRR